MKEGVVVQEQPHEDGLPFGPLDPMDPRGPGIPWEMLRAHVAQLPGTPLRLCQWYECGLLDEEVLLERLRVYPWAKPGSWEELGVAFERSLIGVDLYVQIGLDAIQVSGP